METDVYNELSSPQAWTSPGRRRAWRSPSIRSTIIPPRHAFNRYKESVAHGLGLTASPPDAPINVPGAPINVPGAPKK